MAKAAKKKAPKKRATKYEEPVKFNGSFEDMIAISTTGAGTKKSTLNNMKITQEGIKSAIGENSWFEIKEKGYYEITWEGLYKLFPEIPQPDVQDVVLKIEGLKIIGDGINPTLQIPK